MSENEISWDEAINSGSNFVKLVPDEQKTIKFSIWGFEKVDKFGKDQIEFQAEVLEEDGMSLKEPKMFSTTSNRLKKKLRPILENKKVGTPVKLSIIQVGEKFDTQYSCKEIVE